MQKRRKRKKGYGSWWLAVGRVANGILYMKGHFMNSVGIGVGCLRAGWGVFFLHDACVWGWRFQSLWIAKDGRDMGFVVGGFGGVSGLAENSLVWEAVAD